MTVFSASHMYGKKTTSSHNKKVITTLCQISGICMQVIAMMLLIRINYMKRLTAKYMLVTPYMMMKMFASVNFLKQKYSPAVNTKKTAISTTLN